MKVAFITGIAGQDGSYLAEFLLEKEYNVHGIIRRSSSLNTERIDHIFDKLYLHYGDMTDSNNIDSIICKIKNMHVNMDVFEIYNLAAQSHVQISFELPKYTADVDAIGTLNILESIRKNDLTKITRFYQASTSELYGKVVETPQTELTPFYPRSPYGVAKLYGYWIVKNYRESYNMYACSGILFNHETLAGFMPLIFKEDDIIDIKPISEIVRNHAGITIDENNKHYQDGVVTKNLHVWDNNDWTKVKFASGYPHNIIDDNKKPKFLISNNSAYLTTADHEIIMDDALDVKTKDIKIGDKVYLVNFPENNDNKNIDNDEAEFLGLVVKYGNIDTIVNFINEDKNIIDNINNLWRNICVKYNYQNVTIINNINNNNKFKLTLYGHRQYFDNFNIINEDKTKRVPIKILNSNKNIMQSFLKGYNNTNELKNIKTNSACLAQGLIFLLNKTTQQTYTINVKHTFRHNKNKFLYSINVNDDENNITNNEIKKIINMDNYDGWFYDLETDSGTFHAGIGNGRIHNSPRRGHNFVTRKITIGLGKIIKGEINKLTLGNIDSLRDWGYAKDYVKGMWLMLQQPMADDFVLATNKMYSVRHFIEKAFEIKGFNIAWKGEGVNEIGYDIETKRELIVIDKKYFRPCEVDELCGDYSKAFKELGWQPETSFDELVKLMVDGDC